MGINTNIKLFNDMVDLTNNHMSDKTNEDQARMSFIYAVARVNAYIATANLDKKKDLEILKRDTVQFFSTAYEHMLDEYLQEYIDKYLFYKGINNESD